MSWLPNAGCLEPTRPLAGARGEERGARRPAAVHRPAAVPRQPDVGAERVDVDGDRAAAGSSSRTATEEVSKSERWMRMY
jgi:hypothetical protein